MTNLSPMPDPNQLMRELNGLQNVIAPATLAPHVLLTLGLSDAYWQTATPIGSVFVAYNSRGVSAVHLADDAEAFERYFREHFHRRLDPTNAPDEKLVRAINRRLDGEKVDIRFDLRGLSDFEQAVLMKALQIPRGEIRPYAWIAREIERPKAVRAVGTALGNNPIPLLIPCHRVVRSDGQLGNYALGPERKRTMLEAEGVDVISAEDIAEHGVRYYGSDTTHIFCYPTCRHARRTMGKHLVTFQSEAQARAAGYRPCKVCRPA